MNQTLIQEILEVVEQAAIASAKLTGLGQKDEADAAAVEAMRLRMGKIEMKGKIVIGEGERDEAPMLLMDKKDNNDIEKLLFQLRKRIEKKIRESFKNHVGDYEFYFASLSSKTVVYKGMVRSEILSEFYQDLKEESFKVSFSVYHRRFSTNTLPKWPLAQPMRFLGGKV